MNGRSGRMIRGRDDDAVAEVIGTILLVAVAIIVITGILAWYIPTTMASNEVQFQIAEKSAFSQSISEMNPQSLQNGTPVSLSFPLGIAGVPPFEPASPTQIIVSASPSGYNSTVQLNMSYTVSNSTSHRTVYRDATVTSAGTISSSSTTVYVASISYIIEDGALMEEYSNGQVPSVLGPVPFEVSSGNLFVMQSGITGLPTSITGTGSATVTMHPVFLQDIEVQNNSLGAYEGQPVAISNITLHSMNYTINSTYAAAWDYALYHEFNSSTSGFASVVSLSSWSFSGYAITVHYSNGRISLISTGALKLDVFRFLSVQFSPEQQ